MSSAPLQGEETSSELGQALDPNFVARSSTAQCFSDGVKPDGTTSQLAIPPIRSAPKAYRVKNLDLGSTPL